MASIQVGPGGRYFVNERGEPFFWLGDTQWELFRTRPSEDAEAILRQRKDQGFTAFQVMLTGVGDGSRPNAEGDTPWVEGRPERPNEAYFTNVDRVVNAARKLGVVLVLGVYHQVQRAAITAANARRYARWVAERYAGAPNIVWSMYPEATAEFVPVVREVAAGLREGDGGEHPITVHPDPSPASSSFLHDEEWLAFNSIQPWQSYGLLYPMVAADYGRTPPKPVVMAEGGYEGLHYTREHKPLLIRRQAYWSYLAGGHHTYGHADSHLAPPASWPDWIGSAGARHMGICRGTLTSLPQWWSLVPDQSLLTAGAGEGLTRNVAGRSPEGGWALVYLASSTTVSVDVARAVEGGPFAAYWIDPTMGEIARIGAVVSEGPIAFTTPAGCEDALLLLQREDTG
jgi:hypothetical protein